MIIRIRNLEYIKYSIEFSLREIFLCVSSIFFPFFYYIQCIQDVLFKKALLTSQIFKIIFDGILMFHMALSFRQKKLNRAWIARYFEHRLQQDILNTDCTHTFFCEKNWTAPFSTVGDFVRAVQMAALGQAQNANVLFCKLFLSRSLKPVAPEIFLSPPGTKVVPILIRRGGATRFFSEQMIFCFFCFF